MKCSKNFEAMSSYALSSRASSSAIVPMFRQYMPIQLVASDWWSSAPNGSGLLRSKRPMLSRPRKPPWKTLFPSWSLRFTHHVKFRSSLWKTRTRNSRSGFAGALLVDLVDAPRGPRVDGRVHVRELPLVRGELPVRVHVPLAQEEDELALGEVRVHERERDRVEGEVPRGVPRVLPLVRHREDVRVVEVLPAGVAPVARARAGARGWSGSPFSQRATSYP